MQREKAAALILFGLVAAFLAPTAANSQRAEGRAGAAPEPLLVVRERVKTTSTFSCSVGLVHYGFSYSELTVFDNSQAQETNWSVPSCADPALSSDWKAPVDSEIRRFKLPPVALEQLQSFLDRPEVKALRDFMNAAPGPFGDYDIEIRRSTGVQKISVLSLMPSHNELKRDPTLLRLICRAKEIGGDERPTWCGNLTQTQPVPAR